MNAKIREFKLSLVNFINASNLPIEVVNIILQQLSQEAGRLADEQIKKEIAERSDKESEVQENEQSI